MYGPRRWVACRVATGKLTYYWGLCVRCAEPPPPLTCYVWNSLLEPESAFFHGCPLQPTPGCMRTTMAWLAVLLFTLCFTGSLEQTLSCSCTATNVTSTNTNSLKAQLLSGYDQWQPPQVPTHVSLLFHVSDVYKIDTQSGAFWMDVHCHATWCDCALAYNASLNQDVEDVTWSFDDQEIWSPRLVAFAVRDTLPYRSTVLLVSNSAGVVTMVEEFKAEVVVVVVVVVAAAAAAAAAVVVVVVLVVVVDDVVVVLAVGTV